MSKTVYEFDLNKIDGTKTQLSEYRGKVLLLVNVASKCGLTPQYEGLEKLYSEYKEKGLMVLGFPANEFAGQEPGTNAEIQEFCQMKFGVQFPMFEKVVVKGEGQHPLYAFLTESKPEAQLKKDGKLLGLLREKNLLSGKPHDIKWNFEKFLINRKGEIVERFSPDIEPTDPMITEAIKRELSLA